MNKKLKAYEAPKTEALELSFEGGILAASGPGSGYNKDGGAGNGMWDDDDYSYDF